VSAARTISLIALGILLPLVSARHLVRASEPLRVCTDPNNLPFSHRDEGGFEDALARLVAGELGRPLSRYFWAQRRGFVRNTLKAGKCDLIMGVPADSDMVLTTRPYYRASYVFVTRADVAVPRSFDDPRLRSLRIGVPLVGDDYRNPPPVHALSRRSIVGNVRGFSVFGDYAKDSPPLDPLRSLLRGEIDVAIVWGPLAGFFARRHAATLQIAPVSPRREAGDLFVFPVAMAVHPEARELQQALNGVLERKKRAIQELLRDFGIPQI
jgi:mxaJ protein